MLKATTQPLTTRFYGKTNWGEFAWFVIFMGCLGLGALFIFTQIFTEILIESRSFLRDLTIIIVYMFILILYTSIILYWGFLMRWEYKDGGKNAVEDFWKKFWRGKVPKLVDIRVEQPSFEDYVARLGKYVEDLSSEEQAEKYMEYLKEFGNEWYVVFHFYRGLMHVDVYVYVPVAQMEKFEKMFSDRNYRIIESKDYVQIIYSDGSTVTLRGDDLELYRFLDMLLKTQQENIEIIRKLKSELLSGKISMRDYITKYYKFRYFRKP